MKLLFCFIFLGVTHVSFGQERCGTMMFNGSQSEQERQESQELFEDWLENKINQKRTLKIGGRAGSLSETVYEIPVVVHVVHNGEADGEEGNIPDEQIHSQITTLNEDFRRMNADQSDTPGNFQGVAADVMIEFVLAKRDPEGLPTDGIVRVIGNQPGYTIHEAEALAANSYWPAEEYFNVWVADLKHGSGDGLLGFAKFPVSNEPGMDDDPNLNRLVDGVYMDYEYFGTGYNSDPFSKGRTMTHEVGHWIGLRHVWGDGGCSVDDFCADTPTQGSSSSGCPEVNQTSCTSIDMFQNYMDYTDDTCMNLFTDCQSSRMRTVLENSPRRKELLSSLGTQAPIEVANDLGIHAIISPTFGNCEVALLSQVEVRNYGTNEITSFSIDMLVDGAVVDSKVTTETLTLLQSMFVNFSEVVVSNDVEEISFKVNSVNNGTDGNADNNCKSVNTFFPTSQEAPFVEDFEADESEISQLWQRRNSNNNPFIWGFGNAPNTTTDNSSAMLSYYGAPSGSFGELDYLISPVFDLSELATADIKFKYAYANHSTLYSDALTVVVSTDCGATFPEKNILFQQIGVALSTTSASDDLFIPSDPGDWLEIEINFGEFSGQEVVIAFIGSNGGGNNLYLDDVEIFSSAANEFDIGISKVESLPIVTCKEDFIMDVHVKNYGKETITEFLLNYSFGTREISMKVGGTLSLTSGKTEIVELESYNNEDGNYEIIFEIDAPNGETDQDLSNNSETAYFNIDNNSEIIPIKHKFSSTIENSDWHFIRTDAPTDWSITVFEENGARDYSASFLGYELPDLGSENWLVSPILDFSSTSEASMTFDVSYANRVGRNDQLRILASTNCGWTYPLELYNKKGSELAVAQSETAWQPNSITDWRQEYINLDTLAGDADVRLAFVVTNQNGNNIYLDNIELFESAETPIEIEENMRAFPNPASDYVEVKFNFNIKEEVLMRVVNLNGEVMAEGVYPNTLNQVYRLEILNSIPNGMYLLQVLGNNTNLSNKILIQQ